MTVTPKISCYPALLTYLLTYLLMQSQCLLVFLAEDSDAGKFLTDVSVGKPVFTIYC